jgi:acetylglutamate kinase
MTTGHEDRTDAKLRIAGSMRRARTLLEAMPYIKAYRGSTVVIKYGGSAMVDGTLRETFADDIALLHLVGIKPVIVHGGGPAISAAMGQAGIEPQWIEGLRITDAETIAVVQSTLAGQINPDIVRLVNAHGALATGINGLDGTLFTARPLDERLGFVGEVTAVNPSLIHSLQDRDFVPVVAPLARGEDGNTYNLNADTAAGVLAVALDAAKLVYLTDVPGLYRDLGDAGSLVSTLDLRELEEILGSGSVHSGMLPKLKSCAMALQEGVPRAHILDGRTQHAVLLEIFTAEGIGTMIVPNGESQ